MTADQARQTAEDVCQKYATSLFDRWLTSIRKDISLAVQAGHFGILHKEVKDVNSRTQEILYDKLKKILGPEGYKISPGPSSTVHIEWR